jgi:hypothetical protein
MGNGRNVICGSHVVLRAFFRYLSLKGKFLYVKLVSVYPKTIVQYGIILSWFSVLPEYNFAIRDYLDQLEMF